MKIWMFIVLIGMGCRLIVTVATISVGKSKNHGLDASSLVSVTLLAAWGWYLFFNLPA